MFLAPVDASDWPIGQFKRKFFAVTPSDCAFVAFVRPMRQTQDEIVATCAGLGAHIA